MNELTKHTEHLPDTVEDLRRFLLINREMLQAHMAKLRAIDKVGLARDAHNAALTDAQNLGEVVLRAEAKLGELLKGVPKEPGKRTDKKQPGSPGGTKLQEMGISKKQSHHAQTLASHPEAITQAIEQAKQKEEVPTRAAVLRVIHRETHPPKPREPKLQPQRSQKHSCPAIGIKSKEFSSAFRAFMIEVVKARDGGWQTTSREAALHCLGALECAINLKPQNKL